MIRPDVLVSLVDALVDVEGLSISQARSVVDALVSSWRALGFGPMPEEEALDKISLIAAGLAAAVKSDACAPRLKLVKR